MASRGHSSDDVDGRLIHGGPSQAEVLLPVLSLVKAYTVCMWAVSSIVAHRSVIRNILLSEIPSKTIGSG